MIKHVLGAAAALLLSVASTLPVVADSVAGAYLAGRYAGVSSDFREAAKYYTHALARDTSNVELLESAALSYLSLGRIDRALPLARRLEELGQNSHIGHMVITAAFAEQEEYAALLKRETSSAGIGPWVDGLVKAWAYLGAGNVTKSMAAFDQLSDEPGIRGFVMYHKALALASVGDFESAEEIFVKGGVGATVQTRRGTIAFAKVLAQLGKFEDATQLITTSFADGTDPELDLLLATFKAEKAVPFDQMRSANDGISEVFFTFAVVLKSEAAADNFVLLYSRVARYLRPDHIDALLLTANLLENLNQVDLAIDEYKAVPANDPAYHAAELGRAGALRRSDRVDQAIEVLEQLARSHGDLPVVHSTLGDALRSKDDNVGAIAAYDRAIELTPQGSRINWVLYYSRGIALEQDGDFDRAEADFRAALALNPAQPQVLNYLGYSLVEKQRNLDEALGMIEKAVAASPDSGYIVDSLGWVFYRLGRYEEATQQMERAVELLPVDPVVNDHLGDVYWAVGRAREAEFQWRRALSFVDEDDTESEADPDRMRRKIDVGLDAVLEEEGAEPLTIARDN